MHDLRRFFHFHWARLVRHPSALLLVAGLAILPSAYAWINIKAMWDPYKNTAKLPIAVINEDAGGNIQGKPLFAGREIVNQLRHNHQLGWTFVDRHEAERCLREGRYYASIRIPKDFSARIASILKDRPQRPTIYFTVNEKINAVTPKIAGSGANELIRQISNAFVKETSDALFQSFHEAGIAVQQDLPLFDKAKADLFRLERLLPEIDRLGATSVRLDQKLSDLKQKSEKINALIRQAKKLRQSADNLSQLDAKAPKIRDTLHAAGLFDHYMVTVRSIPSVIRQTRSSINEIENRISALTQTSNTRPADTQRQLAEQYAKLQSISDELDRLNRDAEGSTDKLTELLTHSDQYSDHILTEEWPQVLHTGRQIMQTDLLPVLDDLRQSGTLLQEHLAKSEQIIHQTALFSKNDLPAFEKNVHTAASKIRQFDTTVHLSELIHMLTLNPERHSDFLANPVRMETVHLFPVPNYGTAMAPFYTLLSLWVGATLMISVLPVKRIFPIHSQHLYVHYGQLTHFTVLGLVQAIIVATGDLLLLKISVLHPWLFFWCCLFSSLVFVCITYTLSALLGTIGKGLAVILLVLQISASGGTFPVSMTPSFFQSISAYLPFTYAISLIREMTGGIVPAVVFRDLLVLTIFFIIFLILGSLFCRPVRVRRHVGE